MLYNMENNYDVVIDRNKLIKLGFNQVEVDLAEKIYYSMGLLSLNKLMELGLDYNLARRIKYMYDICTGKYVINDVDSLCKHLRRLNNNVKKVGIYSLPVSKFSRVPRKVIVYGIRDKVFSIYNSKKGKGKYIIYDVVDITNNRVVIETNIKPILKYGMSKKVEGVIEILEVNGDKVKVAINKEYCKLCNRFIITASLKKPMFHHGLIELVAYDGTRVYVYAQSIGNSKEVLKSWNSLYRVYDVGLYGRDIPNKLKGVAKEIYKALGCFYGHSEPANSEYSIIIDENSEGDDVTIEL